MLAVVLCARGEAVSDCVLLGAAKQGDRRACDRLRSSVRTDRVFYVPGEHDVAGDDGKLYRQRYAKEAKGAGWYSFDQKGVHFIGLNNSAQLEGLGVIGEEQLRSVHTNAAGWLSSGYWTSALGSVPSRLSHHSTRLYPEGN